MGKSNVSTPLEEKLTAAELAEEQKKGGQVSNNSKKAAKMGQSFRDFMKKSVRSHGTSQDIIDGHSIARKKKLLKNDGGTLYRFVSNVFRATLIIMLKTKAINGRNPM